MPNIFHIAARIRGRIFSNIDLKEAFFNLAIDDESQQFLAIMGPDNKSYVYSVCLLASKRRLSFFNVIWRDY